MPKILTLAIKAVAFAAAAATTPARAGDQPRDLVILADLAPSLAVDNPDYVRGLAEKIVGQVGALALDYGDRVLLRVANGAAFATKPEGWHRTVELSFHGAQPSDLEAFLRARLNELPDLPKTEDSGLLWALDALAAETDCGARETHLIVVGTGAHLTHEDAGTVVLQGLPGEPFAGCAEVAWMGLAAPEEGLTIPRKDAVEDVFRQLGAALGFKAVTVAQ